MFEFVDSRDLPTTRSITCCESGCVEKIHYKETDASVPLYCWKHRSRYGRHGAVRWLGENDIRDHRPTKETCKSRVETKYGIECGAITGKACQFVISIGKCPGGFK
jgi:hypothetical protein